MHLGNHTSANLSFSDACTTNSITWFPDTDANQHVTPDITGMTHAKPYLDNDQLHVGDGKGLVISNTTHNILHTPKRVFMLSNVLHVPKIKKKRLFSIQQFCHENYVFFEFHSSVFYVKDVVTQFLTHLFDKIFEKSKTSEKQQKSKKYVFLNIFASFLAFLASSQKNLNFQRSLERVRLLTRYF